MKLEEYYAMIAEDFPINKANLGDEAIKTTKLFTKYIQFWSQEKLLLEKIKLSRNTLYATFITILDGKGSDELNKKYPAVSNAKAKTNMVREKFIESQPEIEKLSEQLIIQEVKVEVLDAALKEIRNRGYSIKNAIDMVKFEAGF